MKATICVLLLGLSAAIAAETEKKTIKRNTLDKFFAYGSGQEVAGLDLNSLSFQSSPASDTVAVNNGHAVNIPVVSVPGPYDIGATVSRHVTITRNFGVPVGQVAQEAQPVRGVVPVAVPQTVPVEVHQPVHVPVQRTVVNRVVPVLVGVSVPLPYQIPASQQYASQQYAVPLKNTGSVQVIAAPLTQFYAAPHAAAPINIPAAAPSPLYTQVISPTEARPIVSPQSITGHIVAPAPVSASIAAQTPLNAPVATATPLIAPSAVPIHYAPDLPTQTIPSDHIRAAPISSHGPSTLLLGESGFNPSFTPSFEKSFRQPNIPKNYNKWQY